MFVLLLVSCCFITTTFSIPILNHPAYAQQKPIPPYAKWGVYALKKVKQKYPNAQVIDYAHLGRTSTVNTSTESFKLWLRDGKKEFGVFIDITFDKGTEQIIKVTFKESTR
ncbi:DUF3889 domain-containing protein [Peribacillus deserti]|uniref:DUF3889 domain-containing protein n=1 Tax=Peribacillus deserti TaxID=673318 RepID=UPI001EF9AB02|nr:DUF3889 domain-containing protein [Peribacillus deserti]